MQHLQCLLDGCDEKADGLVMVNENNSGLTIFMIPACRPHGLELKSKDFYIELNLNANPKVGILGDMRRPNPDLTLEFEIVDLPYINQMSTLVDEHGETKEGT